MVTPLDLQAGRELPEPELSEQDGDDDRHDLVTAVRGLAELAANVHDLDGVLTQIAHFTVDSVPGAEGSGVTLMQQPDTGPPKVLAWATTAVFVREIDHLQYDILAEGPCLTAMETRRTLVSGSIGKDARWPRLGGRVARLNVHSALAVPLISGGVVVGALNIYAREPDTFTEHAARIAERYGSTAAVTVANIQALQAAHTRATQLEAALHSRATIDQAIGIIRSRTGASEQEGFARLRQISQDENIKLAVIAERIVEEAVRRARARHATT